MTFDVKHSGQLGDIVYAMPAMKALARLSGSDKVRLSIPRNKQAHRPAALKHVGGDFMISDEMFAYLKPLLTYQECFSEVVSVDEREIPSGAADFDVIRSGCINVSAGNIKDYYFKVFGLVSRGTSPWITPSFDGRRSGQFDIVIGRSTRYLNQGIDYGILAALGLRIGFIGTANEYLAFANRFPSVAAEYVPTSSAMEACDLIASSSLFIGNQSFFFAVAEALQANRLLEVFEPVPNVLPTGGMCGQFIATRGFATLLRDFFDHPLAISKESHQLQPNYLLSI
ncbi:hypothetical protein LJ656_11670 [Paraburkholderia sp. MMS20-SJTR3]|uniref:ADP-heptose:LPS heptosyltransferase n=1 Tax=Paraburkholderia sejongensis TaxID=2886946 RepID=A0ABS8JTL8_9BURK|nr:hypothetical protein [Paraburkholderia sp. MMS20-SJTR3]MCC8393251.1 hypothetical protein [Paraburkholderia sp. MMS20-SJTR3]